MVKTNSGSCIFLITCIKRVSQPLPSIDVREAMKFRLMIDGFLLSKYDCNQFQFARKELQIQNQTQPGWLISNSGSFNEPSAKVHPDLPQRSGSLEEFG